MRAPTFRRFLCVLALPCALAVSIGCSDDDDKPSTPAAAGAAGTDAGAGGTTGPVLGVGNGGTTGSGGELTGNGNNDGDPKPPDGVGGPQLPGEGAGGAIQVGGMGGSS